MFLTRNWHVCCAALVTLVVVEGKPASSISNQNINYQQYFAELCVVEKYLPNETLSNPTNFKLTLEIYIDIDIACAVRKGLLLEFCGGHLCAELKNYTLFIHLFCLNGKIYLFEVT